MDHAPKPHAHTMPGVSVISITILSTLITWGKTACPFKTQITVAAVLLVAAVVAAGAYIHLDNVRDGIVGRW